MLRTEKQRIDGSDTTRPQVAYLCLQAAREGQASHAHAHEIIKGLKARGWVVRLHQPDYAKAEGHVSVLRRVAQFVRVQRGLVRALKRDSGILYCRAHFAAWPASFAARMLRIPVVQEVNGVYEDLFLAWPVTRRFAPLFKGLIRSQLKWADAVIVVTPELNDWVRRETGHRFVITVRNGANTELFHPGAVTKMDLPERYVAFVGAFTRWQGLHVILDAVRRPEWPKGVTAVLAGDGYHREQVEAAARAGLPVSYLGTVPYGEVPGILAGSLAALSPKVGDLVTYASPLKVYEALACGTPVIASDFPGQVQPLAESEGGLVVPAGDARALALAVARVSERPDLARQLGRRGRRYVEKAHSWDHRAAATHEVLQGVIQRASR